MKRFAQILLAMLTTTAVTTQEIPLTEVCVEALIESLTPQPVIRFRGIDVEQIVDAPNVALLEGSQGELFPMRSNEVSNV